MRSMRSESRLLSRLVARRCADVDLGVFPPTWRVPEMLCEEFCFVTREHLTAQLDEKGCTVQVLLHAIQKTLAFETYLGEYFSAEKYAVCYSELATP